MKVMSFVDLLQFVTNRLPGVIFVFRQKHVLPVVNEAI